MALGDTKLKPDNQGKVACKHPCFDNCDFHHAVIHLPVAASGNIGYREDMQKGGSADILPGGTVKKVLFPHEAAKYFIDARKSIPNLTVAAISGPGEALADFDTVKNTFRLVRQANPEILLCLSTNGLMLPIYANHLISLGVNYVTVTLHTVKPETGARIYEHITYLGHRYSGVKGAGILLQNQIWGISYLASRNVSVRLNIPVTTEVSEGEISEMVRLAKEWGCKLTNIIKPSKGRKNDENGPETYNSDEWSSFRHKQEKVITQSYFCKPCYASTVETLNTRILSDIEEAAGGAGPVETPSAHLRFAVCSKSRTLTDQHFGHATKIYIYDYDNEVITFVEARPIEQYCRGGGEGEDDGRIYKLIRTIEDCNCVICMRIGICPSDALKEKNIKTYTTYNLIEDGIREAVNRLYLGFSFENRQ
ncbi:NifB/NifX family molybdenum-iron cluster-binding protein [Lachnospiraceae bacterium 54-53]